MDRKASEVSKIASENTEMQAAEFAQTALQYHIAPRAMGPVIKARLPHARRILGKRGWSKDRVRALWYADERASAPKWNEIRDLEELTGLRCGREELREVDNLIANADRLRHGTDPDFYRPFVAAVRAFFGAPDRTGTEGDE
jgi:hypothetical protein